MVTTTAKRQIKKRVVIKQLFFFISYIAYIPETGVIKNYYIKQF